MTGSSSEFYRLHNSAKASETSLAVRIILIFIAVSGGFGFFIGAKVFPFTCPAETLAYKLLPEPEVDIYLIKDTLGLCTSHLATLQKGIQNSSEIDSVLKDPFAFSPVKLTVPGEDESIMVSGPVRDLYGFPLVPLSAEIDEGNFFIELPGGPALFSFACAMREQMVNAEIKARNQKAAALKEKLEKIQKLTIVAWLVISLLFTIIWAMLQKYIPYPEKVIFLCIALITYFALITPGTRHGTGFSDNDTLLIKPEHRQEIALKFENYLAECLKEGKLDQNEYDQILSSFGKPGDPLPAKFSGKFRLGSFSLDYWGVSELIKRNQEKAFFSVTYE